MAGWMTSLAGLAIICALYVSHTHDELVNSIVKEHQFYIKIEEQFTTAEASFSCFLLSVFCVCVVFECTHEIKIWIAIVAF